MYRVVISILLPICVSTALPAQDAAMFDASLAKIRGLMKRGKWKSAEAGYRKLLKEHEKRSYVLQRRTEIEEDLKRCAFGARYSSPKAPSLVSGKLVSYSERTGKIKVTYTPKQLADFQAFEDSEYIAHPLKFAGPYTVEVRGKKYPMSKGVQLIVGDTGKRSYLVVFGVSPYTAGSSEQYVPASINRIVGESDDQIAFKKISPVKHERPFKVRVKVTAKDIALYSGSRKFLSAKWDSKKSFGGFGLFREGFDSVTIEGKAQPSWIQGLIDKANQKNMAAFERTWQPKKALPAWLHAAKAAKATEVLTDEYPVFFEDKHNAAYEKLHKMLEEQKVEEALAYAERLTDEQFPKLASLWFRITLLDLVGRYEKALTLCSEVCRAKPEFLTARAYRARFLFMLRRGEEGARIFDELLVKHADAWDVNQMYALLLLRSGRVDRAREVVRKARRNPSVAAKLRPLSKMLLMAEKGPSWPRTYEYQSRHYHIVSDIDRKTCIEASRILEEAFTAYKIRLGGKKLDESKRFRVFLFSGEAGYQAYCKDIVGAPVSHTAGLYSPSLKQLLIWNLPDRGEMMQTVRHEGFHQFLDRISTDPPVWFNEGMAEYYETMKRGSDGRLAGGQVRADHLETISGMKLMPMRDFVRIGRKMFYDNARLTYAQGWAVVHFLRHANRDSKAIFAKLLSALQKDESGEAAVEQAFAGVDWQKLDTEFRAYLGRMK